MVVVIDWATTADWSALQKMQALQGDSQGGNYFAAQDAAGRRIFWARRDGEPAAYGLFNPQSRYALYRRLNIPEIQDLNVVPTARRQGVGAACLAWCEEKARAMDYGQIGISVGLHSGFGAAQRLYMKSGYMPDGFGVTYDRETVAANSLRPVDDQLCLMLVKELNPPLTATPDGQ